MSLQKEFEEWLEIVCHNRFAIILLRHYLEYSFAYNLHFELLLVKAYQCLFGYFCRFVFQLLVFYYVFEQHSPEYLRHFADLSRYSIKFVLCNIRLTVKRLLYSRFRIRLILPR